MGVVYENLIVAGGRFTNDGGDIETVTVPANSTIKRGTVMGKITASGKYVTSLSASSDGSQIATTILAEDAVNDTAAPVDIKAVIYKKGTFNSLGVVFGTGQTLANTKDSLHNVSIEITLGVA
jgi:hypothetical protein